MMPTGRGGTGTRSPDIGGARSQAATMDQQLPHDALAASAQLRTDRRTVQWALTLTAMVALFGIVARFQMMLGGLARPAAGNIFTRLYALHELPFLLLLLAVVLGVAVLVGRARGGSSAVADGQAWTLGAPSNRALSVVGAIVFVTTVGATFLVMHRLLFSMDEFSADFQARIFAAGRVVAPLPSAWREFGSAIIPIFVTYRPESGGWLSAYLPGYALMKAPFIAANAGVILNPLLASIAIIALGASARRLWPNEGTRPWLAVALLATSSQFVITSATGYSMPAHLCLNLVWLYLYLRGDQRSWIAALVVGVLALGLHNPFPHALFVAPFLVRLLLERRWRRVGEAMLVYGAGAVMWLAWLRFSYPVAESGGGLLSLFAVPAPIILWVNGVSFSLLFTWQAPLFGALFLVALMRVRRLGAPLTDLALGVLLTLGFFLFFPSTQGHGWGHRYAYQVLGSMALLAAAGVEPLITVLGERKAQFSVAASLLLGLLVQLPWRALQTERFVRPFAMGYDYVVTRPAEVVIVHTDSIWYGRDAVRNDPWLRGQPVIVRAGALTAEQRSSLDRAYSGRIVEVSNSELLQLGMTRWTGRR
jgi:hypothetical protein